MSKLAERASTAPGAATLPTSSTQDAKLLEKVKYKGFINCDHPTRKPNGVTVEGMHSIFTNKKQMKQAQDENPLAGRGFKKQVVLLCQPDGFRLDMMSADADGALLHAPVIKMIMSLAIDKLVYVVVARGQKAGKFTCHCMEAGKKEKATIIAEFFNAVIEEDHPAQHSAGGGAAGHAGTKAATFQFGARKAGSFRDDEESARLRKRGGMFDGEFPDDIDTDEIKESALEEYLAADGAEPGAGSTATLAIKRGDLLKFQQEMQGFAEEPGGDGGADGGAPVKVGIEAKPWYHGDVERVVAERRLMGNPVGTFLVRVSSDKSGYTMSMINVGGKVRHYKILPVAGSRWCLQGHDNSYASVAALVLHYTDNSITAEGDKCGDPCYESD